ncbi:putative mitochondrial outer membrane protein [Terfezia boudieri ATCC MYA-4762]|uniref:Putative mitochondrial outer membrane protein n=1 Tax=Terfezia boudieri ATCC MYA-4762 TaxID=1051890 RepID=A0A3N4LJC9_9PEZI|nr:putative mitochondrial outer membrane protein [Terfezia boudieri ATCC MYA-4762]
MASNPLADDDVFERLKRPADPEILKEREKAVKERVRAQYEKYQKRLAELVQDNSTLPVHIRSIHVDGAKNTRRGFLKKVFEPVLSKEKQEGYTLETAMRELQKATGRLHQFEIFHPNISISLDTPPQPLLSANEALKLPTPLDVILLVKERPRLTLKSGTDFGNTEGTGYVTLFTRNLLGGADILSLSASTGTRTRSAYDAYFHAPLFSNPDLCAFAAAYATSRSNHDFASHEQVDKGGRVGLSWVTPGNRDRHELCYEGVCRAITELSSDASESIRSDAGKSFKSAIRYSFTRDWRDNPLLPSRGYLFKTSLELAGKLNLGGGVHHVKTESEFQFSTPLIPHTPTPPSSSKLRTYLHHSTLTTTLRTGLLYPLTAEPTRFPDRFRLGGPTSLRSFRESGLGPHDGRDALGGDLYLATCTSLLLPIPHVGPDKPIRFQMYLNGGRLLAWDRGMRGGVDIPEVLRRVFGNAAGWPSTSAGVGFVYAHSVARVEVNFGVPLVIREGERARKGFQFGLGISLM